VFQLEPCVDCCCTRKLGIASSSLFQPFRRLWSAVQYLTAYGDFRARRGCACSHKHANSNAVRSWQGQRDFGLHAAFSWKKVSVLCCRTILQLFNCAFQPRDVTSSLFAFMIRCYGIQLYQLCLWNNGRLHATAIVMKSLVTAVSGFKLCNATQHLDALHLRRPIKWGDWRKPKTNCCGHVLILPEGVW